MIAFSRPYPGSRQNAQIFPKEQSNFYLEDTDEMTRIGNRWALGFVGLGLAALLGNFILSTGFAVAGERMTRSLRKMAFESMVS